MPKISKHAIYTAVFNRMLDGSYPDGFRLIEADLAKQFGVSRTPVREILRELEKDGMVRILPHRGALVKSLTEDDVEEIYEIRKRLEVLALEIAVPLMSLKKLGELRRSIRALSRSGRPGDISKADVELHKYIMVSSGRERLIGMLNQLMRIMQGLRQRGYGDPAEAARATGEHMRILNALMRRDAREAAAGLVEHIESSKRLVLSFLAQ